MHKTITELLHRDSTVLHREAEDAATSLVHKESGLTALPIKWLRAISSTEKYLKREWVPPNCIPKTVETSIGMTDTPPYKPCVN